MPFTSFAISGSDLFVETRMIFSKSLSYGLSVSIKSRFVVVHHTEDLFPNISTLKNRNMSLGTIADAAEAIAVE